MSTQNVSVVLAERPAPKIIPGKTFAKKVQPAPTEADLKDGEILAETLYISLDPAMRGWLNDARSYIPPVQIGEVMRAGAVCRVLASRSKLTKRGDLVYGMPGWQEISILSEKARTFEAPLAGASNGRPTDLIGVLGITGLTAYMGIKHIADIKPGETVVVSGAAGATGSVAGQIAKHVYGARVVGIAGGEEKCRWLVDELGFDAGVDYKAADFKAKFAEATKGFIDVYWDNVGGEILDLALSRAKKHARFIMCGGISTYNDKAGDVRGPRNINMVIAMSIKMQGFIVFDYAQEYASARRDLAKWIDEGKIKRGETIVKGGLDVVEQSLVDLFNGVNKGKLLVEVKSLENPKL